MDNDKKAKWGLRGLVFLALAGLGTMVGIRVNDFVQYKNKLNNPDTIARYIVKKGDKLDKIGEEQGFCPTTWMKIRDWRYQAAKMNGRAHNPDSLVPGEELTVPVWYENK